MRIPGWLIGGLAGGLAMLLALLSWMGGKQKAQLHWRDSTRAAYVSDSSAFAARDAALTAQRRLLQAALDSIAAQATRDSAAAAVARRTAAKASAGRDSAIASLGLSTQQLEAVRSQIAQADAAHATELGAVQTELVTAREAIRSQVAKAAQLESDTTDVRAELRKRDEHIHSLDSTIAAGLAPKPPAGKFLGFLPRLYCGPGVGYGVDVDGKNASFKLFAGCVKPL